MKVVIRFHQNRVCSFREEVASVRGRTDGRMVVVVVVWQLSCRGSYNLLKRDCVADAVPLFQYTHWNWYSFRQPRKDDRLSQPPGVLIQRPTGLELRTLGSQAATLITEPTPGSTLNVLGLGEFETEHHPM